MIRRERGDVRLGRGVAHMKKLLPGRVELAIFTTLAILLAAIAWQSRKPDLVMAASAVPLFITCAVLGMRRNTALAPVASQDEAGQMAEQQEVGVG